MKRAIYILSLSLFVCITFAPEALAHKYHTSVTRLEYNAEERSAEITIQTFADDLEDILSKRAGKSVRLDASKDVERLAFDYVRSVIELKSRNGSSELQWVGMEVKGSTVWLYVLAKMPEGLAKASVRNSLLFDLFEDQVNIVNVWYGEKKTSLVFKRGDNMQEIP
jgi:hypothetical protein